MYASGQIVHYGTYGICRVEGLCTKQFGKEEMEYYVLKPVAQEGSTLYVPTGNEKLVSRMQPLLTAQEIHDIICSAQEGEDAWIEEDNRRREIYYDILHKGDRVGMAHMIRTLFLRQQELSLKRKKLHMADEKILKEAERVLREEFAYVLGIEAGQVESYILVRLREKQKEVKEA